MCAFVYFFPTFHLVNSYSPFKIQLINDDFQKYLSAEQLLGLSGLAASCSYLCCSAKPAAVEFICFHDASSVTVYSTQAEAWLSHLYIPGPNTLPAGSMWEEGTKQSHAWCVVYIYSGFSCSLRVISWTLSNPHSSNCQKEEGICLYPISNKKLLGNHKRTSRRLCNVVGSRKSFGGQVKIESITHVHGHMHMYMHAHIHAYIHAYIPATLPEWERGLHHSAESRLHWHSFVLRDKTMPSRTHNSDELLEK